MKTVTPKIAELMNSEMKIPYQQAKVAVLNSELNAVTSSLRDSDFQRLLSKPSKAMFNDIATQHNQTLPAFTPSAVTYNPTPRVLNNTLKPWPSIDMGLNINLLIGAGLATAGLAVLALFRGPRILAAPYRFFKNTGASVVRYFNQADAQTNQPMEIVISKPAANTNARPR